MGHTIFTNEGIDSVLPGAPRDGGGPLMLYFGNHDPHDPLISQPYAGFNGFCHLTFSAIPGALAFFHCPAPSRWGSRRRCMYLSAMSHALNIRAQLPEAREANLDMVRFFDECTDAAAR